MNTETGDIYRGVNEIIAAQLRGEPIVPVSEKVAWLMEDAKAMNRAERREAGIVTRLRKMGTPRDPSELGD